MVRRFAVVVAWLAWSGGACAEAVSLEFRDVKVSALAQAVVRDLLVRDYVISSDVAGMSETVSVSIKSVEREAVLDVLRQVVGRVGVSITETDGVLYLARSRAMDLASRPVSEKPVSSGVVAVPAPVVEPVKDSDEVRAYFPSHRSPEFLALAARAAGARVVEAQAKDKLPAVVYAGSEAVVGKVGVLLVDLDRPVGGIQVRAAVLEVTESESEGRGFSGALAVLGGKLGLTLGTGAALGNALSWRGHTLQAVLSAVSGDSRFRYVAEPSLRVLDGEVARLVVGADVPVRGAITTDRNGNQLQSVEYKTAGVILILEPRILRESVQLKVRQQLSTFQVTNTSGIDSPSLSKREAETVVEAGRGELIAIAGLDETRDQETGSGLSFLPAVLRSSSRNQARSQVVLLLEVQRI